MFRWLLSALLLLGIGGVLVFGWARHALEQPLPLPAAAYVIDIPPGSSFKSVVQRLSQDGLLRHQRLFEWYARINGQHTRIRAGEYAVMPGTTAPELIEQLVAGRVLLHPVTLVEGWTVAEMLAALRRHPVVRTTLEVTDPVPLAAALGLDFPNAEGLFLPDTYLVPRGTTDVEVLLRAHRLLLRLVDELWSSRDEQLPLADPYELLILASIIERETALDSERNRVAGVFVRRLQRGMRLQTDPTVIYGLGPDYHGVLTRSQLSRDTPWNTYTRDGLPPTPIALPGAASLRAALAPDDSDALFFVATGHPDGSHEFTATLEAHNAAVRRYRQRLRERERERQ